LDAVSIQGKPELFLIMDNPAVGDKSKLNPEDLSSWSSTLYSPYIEINELRDYF
jgi:hypothetical protein